MPARRVASRFMTESERRGRIVDPCCRTRVLPAAQPFPIAMLRCSERCVEPIPHRAPDAASNDATPSGAERLPTRGHERRQASRRAASERRQCMERVSGARRACSHRQSVCPRVNRWLRAWQHQHHSRRAGQLSMAHLPEQQTAVGQSGEEQAVERQVPKRQVSGTRRERRGGWTFTLGACQADFTGPASLPRPEPTVTSVRGSLGSCQGERRPWLTFPVQSRVVRSRVLVSKLGSASYIGAGEARQSLDGAAANSQYAWRRHHPFAAKARDLHERCEPISPPREQLGARCI
jgi:hypothetical protein